MRYAQKVAVPTRIEKPIHWTGFQMYESRCYVLTYRHTKVYDALASDTTSTNLVVTGFEKKN